LKAQKKLERKRIIPKQFAEEQEIKDESQQSKN